MKDVSRPRRVKYSISGVAVSYYACGRCTAITDAQNLMPSCADCAVTGQTLCLDRHSAYSTPHLNAHGQLLTESVLVAQVHSINTGRRAHHGGLRAEETEVQAPDCSNLDLLLTRL